MAEPPANPASPASQTSLSPLCRPVKPPLSAGSASKRRIHRRVLADVTNDAEVEGQASQGNAGLALSSSPNLEATPRGDDALRSQVKSLLQKVETEIHKVPSLRSLSHINCFLASPSRLAASTPYHTPAATIGSPSSPRRIPVKNMPLPVYVDLAVSSFAKTDLLTVDDSRAEPTTPEQAYFDASDLSCLRNTSALVTPVSSVSQPVDSERQANASGIRGGQMHSPVSTLSQLSNTGIAFPEPEILSAGSERVTKDEDGHKRASDMPGNPVTRGLQFGTPGRDPAVEISVSSLTSSSSSENRSVLPVEKGISDTTSDWSVLVNFSSPEDACCKLVRDAHGTGCRAACIASNPLYSNPASVNSRLESNENDAWAQRSTGSNYLAVEDCADYSEGQIDGYKKDVEENEVDCSELCRSLGRMTVGQDDRRGLPEYKGKHSCFIYNSDDEIEGELVLSSAETRSPNVLHLKGLPTPKGKHLRFPADDRQ